MLRSCTGVDPKNIDSYDTYERLADNPAIDPKQWRLRKEMAGGG